MNEKKLVRLVNSLESKFEEYTNQELLEQTKEFKKILSTKSKTMFQILPEAFAVVREAIKRITGKRLYDVQIIGGYYLSKGKIAEIKAGEGKTLIQSLPAYLYALDGKGVHVVTTNEYLSKRDFGEVGKILEFLGITVGLIYYGMERKERIKAYKKDVTYGSNTEFGFDYLRDNIAYEKDEIVQNGLNCAIIDEADSILLDEGQTPMIISEKKNKPNKYQYIKANNFVNNLKGINVLNENIKNKKQLKEIEEYDYVIYDAYKEIELTQKGIKKAEREYELQNLYESENIEIINYIKQALRANKILKKDEDYIVKDNNIFLIDIFTGRIMYGKRYTNGLQEAIEIKENIEVQESSEMLASITTQNYFKMYKKICGMTGTAKTSEKEFNNIYHLEVKKVPVYKKSKRKDKKNRIFYNIEDKYDAIIKEIKKSNLKGQPVLVGTTSIEKSEKLSELLNKSNIKHNILNAKNHEEEAKIVSEAGKIGKVTIATNMAGRGTNILLGGTDFKEREKVVSLGGLKVIGTEKHESRRIDEQLRGRSGRQGEIGESIFYLSLEDEIIRRYRNINTLKRYSNNKKIELKDIFTKIIISKIQKKAEDINYSIRKRIVEYDEVLNINRNIIYRDRRKVLEGECMEITKEFILYFCKRILEDKSSKSIKVLNSIEKEEKITLRKENVEEITQIIYEKIIKRENELGKEKFDKILKNKLLKTIDENLTEYLEQMDDLKLNMELRAYGGYNPIDEYAKEGRQYLDITIDKIKMNFVNKILFNANYI